MVYHFDVKLDHLAEVALDFPTIKLLFFTHLSLEGSHYPLLILK